VWRPASVVFFRAMVTPNTTLAGGVTPSNDKAKVLFAALVTIVSVLVLWDIERSTLAVEAGVVIPLHFKVKLVLPVYVKART